MRKTGILFITFIFIVLGLLFFGRFFLSLLLSYREHVALGFKSVYMLNLKTQLSVALISAIVLAIITLFTIRKFRKMMSMPVFLLISVVAAVFSCVIGYGIGNIDPTKWMLFFHHNVFHKADPIFNKDYSFYVYTLPVLKSFVEKIVGVIFYILFLQILVLFGFIAMNDAKESMKSYRGALRTVALIFIFFGIQTFLGRYSALYNESVGNFLYGPGFTVTHWTIPVSIWVRSIALVFIGLIFFVGSFMNSEYLDLREYRTYKLPVISIVSFIGVSILLALVGVGINAFHVHPNEQSTEAPYIKRTIDATRWALDINDVKTKTFNPTLSLSNQTIKTNQMQLDNVRINDIGQTKEIYNQLQSFKNYFVFNKANADRYNGQEVYIDVRELDNTKLPVQTWINKNLVYTHGYGIAASPVNKFDSDGLPIAIAKDTPQKTEAPLPKITQPNIYFGAMNNDVIAPSKAGEFDYPVGDSDHNSHYKGGYNLPIKGNKLLLAIEKGSLKYFTSNQITDQSQLVFDRNIYKRVNDIAPFLTYDSDAYPFITEDGKIKWMLDAYTQTSNIPYAQNFGKMNYERNSVKVVIDAYSGKVTYYVIDQKDPMIQSLMALYPNMFTTKVPKDVEAHFRYPSDLFNLQSKAITSYHMTNANAFYNQEDLWDLAEEIYNQNQKNVRPPVYQMIQMPGETKPSFVLSELFTPNNKMNLNGWLVANNEPGHYGELTLYQFPQDKLFFGPMQAENQIDSDPNVSSQLTLWNQQGSHVVRGNLLLVPIGNTALYIEPVYLVADRQGSLPQLQRVIVDFNKRVYIGNSLTDALKQMVSGIVGAPPDKGQTGTGQGGGNAGGTQGNQTMNDLAKQANQLLDQYKKDTASGNLEKAGQDLAQVQKLIQQMTTLKK